MGKRGENIRKRLDGRWEARVVRGKPIQGKTDYKYFYGKSYREVKQKKRDYLCKLAMASQKTIPAEFSGFISSPGIQTYPASRPPKGDFLFEGVVYKWMEEKKMKVKESTFAYYVTMINNHILPELGKTPLRDMTTQFLTDFLMDRKEHGGLRTRKELADKTVFDLKTILMQILYFANLNGFIDMVPVSPSLSCRRKDISVLSQKEQEKLEKIVLEEETPFGLGILLSLYAGLRIGEVCAMQWKNLDRKDGMIHVEKTMMRISRLEEEGSFRKTKIILGDPKTVNSIRQIPLPDAVYRYFVQHRQADSRYIATGTVKFMEPRVCLDRYKRLLHRAGISDHTFHTLRHTFATRCVENGMDIKSLSEMMGHSSVKITMQRYVHPSIDFKKKQMNKLRDFSSRHRKHFVSSEYDDGKKES